MLEQLLFGIAPGNACGVGLAQGLGLLGGGKSLVDLEQGRAFGVLGFARRARVGHDALDELAQLLPAAEQRDGVVVALAHLAAVQAGQGGHVLVDHRFGQHEVLAVEVVEAGAHVARHLDVLHLVAPHGHLVCLEHQDVGAHEHGVHEQAGGHAVVLLAPGRLVLVLRGLVGVGAVEQAFAGHAGQQPGQFGDFRNIGLAVEDHLLRVQAGSEPAGRDLQRGALDAHRVLALDERVVVGQEVEALHAGPQARLDRGANGAHVVA